MNSWHRLIGRFSLPRWDLVWSSDIATLGWCVRSIFRAVEQVFRLHRRSLAWCTFWGCALSRWRGCRYFGRGRSTRCWCFITLFDLWRSRPWSCLLSPDRSVCSFSFSLSAHLDDRHKIGLVTYFQIKQFCFKGGNAVLCGQLIVRYCWRQSFDSGYGFGHDLIKEHGVCIARQGTVNKRCVSATRQFGSLRTGQECFVAQTHLLLGSLYLPSCVYIFQL